MYIRLFSRNARYKSSNSYHQDDQEKWSRRNIRIRGLPETVETKDLAFAATVMFNQLLQKPEDATLELDRIHGALGPKNPNPAFPRDVICRVHFYAVEAEIMQAARKQDSNLLNGTRVSLLPDLSKLALDMSKDLKPLTGALQAKQMKYHWGFPFQVVASHEGKSAIFPLPLEHSSSLRLLPRTGLWKLLPLVSLYLLDGRPLIYLNGLQATSLWCFFFLFVV